MLKNYILIAWRTMLRNRYYSVPSVLGLALGISCSLLIILYVFDELSYDQFHTKKERIYRISQTIDHNGEINAALTSTPVVPQLQQDFPEIENAVRFIGLGQKLTVKVEDKIYREQDFWRVDSTIFEIFDYPLIVGSRSNALKEPNAIVLSEELANKYFGSIQNALKKRVEIRNRKYIVSGVVDSKYGKSDIKFNAFVPIHGIPNNQMSALNQDWFRLVSYSFVLTNRPLEKERFDAMFQHLQENFIQPYAKTFGANSSASFISTPLSDLHFENNREYDLPKGNINYLIIFFVIAFFILIIASINYTNLSLAQSIKRAKEVGVRKALGAEKQQIVQQFLGEALLITMLSIIIAISFAELSLPLFNSVTQKEISLSYFDWYELVLILFGLMIIVAALAGFYPAFVLSKFQAVDILRGNLPKVGNFKSVRTAMIGLQFVFSIFMVITTYAIYQQMSFIQNKDLGFNKEDIVVIHIPQDTAVYRHLESFKKELDQSSQVEHVTGSGGVPGRRAGELMFRVEQQGKLVEKSLKVLFVDDQFFDVFDIRLVNGRLFDKERVTDQQKAFIVNQSATEILGWKSESIGKRMQWGLLANNTATNDGNVIGIIEDFNFASLHNPIEPLAICYNPNNSSMISIRFSNGNIRENLDYLNAVWAQYAGNHPLEYEFMDDRLTKQYQSEYTLFKVGSYFSFISMFISLIGLFSLVSFSVEQRIKEIGIRKVLGASNLNLINVISNDFLRIIAGAAIIVAPLSYLAISYWLGEFNYSIGIPYAGFILTMVAVVFISLVIISFHVGVVSRNRPIRALRRE